MAVVVNGFACSGGVKRTTKEVLSDVVRPKHKGPFTSTDGKYRKFTDGAEVDLTFLVKKHKEDIAKGKTFADSRHAAVLACVFYSLPTEVLSGGLFAEGRMYENGLILWVRKQSEYCQDLNYNNGGGGRTPTGVARCGGSAWLPRRCRREPRRDQNTPRLACRRCNGTLRHHRAECHSCARHTS
jgi:hypothetical protein